MNGVGAFPEFIGRDGENTHDPPEPVIGCFGFEKSAMAAIMLDDKQADQENTGWQSQ